MKPLLPACLFVALAALVSPDLSAQCYTLLQGPAAQDTLCDESPNDPSLWNQQALWDPANNTHDLAEGATDLSLRLRDTCGGLSIGFRLFLDLNGNGVAETVLTDGNLLSGGRFLYNNANSPAFLSGDTLLFDGRPLLPADKYRFALEAQTSGDTLTARLRWATEAAPSTYRPVQLPLGAHRIEWLAVQNGDTTVYAGNFLIRDCKKPTVVCLNGLSVNIMPTQMITLWASDFLQYTEDNVTPSNQLEIAIIKSGDSNGVYPVDFQGNPVISVNFKCDEVGTHTIQLWSKDNAGNTAFCETTVMVKDPNQFCIGSPTGSGVCIKEHCFNEPIEEVVIELASAHPALPPVTIFEITNSSGCAFLPSPLGGNITVIPVKDDNFTNGVTTFDMVLIARHILGLEPLNSPYKQIAADVNKSNSITTFDIVELRKLILGIYSELPWNASWRFVDKAFTFPNPNNPFTSPFPETIDTSLSGGNLNLEFVGVKIGDVNCSATVNNVQSPAEERSSAWLLAPDQFLRAGETTDIPVSALQDADWYGLQWSFETDPAALQIETVLPGSLPGFDEEAWSLQNHILNGSWFDVQPAAIQSGAPLFYLRVKALRDIRMSDVLKIHRSRIRPEAYGAEGRSEDLQLQFYKTPDISGLLQVFNAQPNPTTAGFRLPVRLETPADLHLQLFDLQGRICWEMHTQAGAGMQELIVPAAAMAQEGLYLWRLTDGKGSWSGKVVVGH